MGDRRFHHARLSEYLATDAGRLGSLELDPLGGDGWATPAEAEMELDRLLFPGRSGIRRQDLLLVELAEGGPRALARYAGDVAGGVREVLGGTGEAFAGEGRCGTHGCTNLAQGTLDGEPCCQWCYGGIAYDGAEMGGPFFRLRAWDGGEEGTGLAPR